MSLLSSAELGFVLCTSLNTSVRSPLRDMVVGKIQGGRKKMFSNVLRSLAKLLRSLAKIFAFPGKTFAFPRKDICVLSQNQLSSDCLLYSLQWFIQLHMFTMERFIEFYFELGLKYKEIQSVLSSRHGFGTF